LYAPDADLKKWLKDKTSKKTQVGLIFSSQARIEFNLF